MHITITKINNFNPRSPHGERLFRIFRYYIALLYFNPRSPHGERLKKVLLSSLAADVFQSTLPAWGATVQSKHTAMTA